MKKAVALILCVVLSCCVLVGCGTKVKNEENREIGKQAIEITDSYLAGEIDAEEAVEKLNDISEKVVDEDSSYDGLLRVGIGNISSEIVIAKNVGIIDGIDVGHKDIVEARNVIADYIGAEKK